MNKSPSIFSIRFVFLLSVVFNAAVAGSPVCEFNFGKNLNPARPFTETLSFEMYYDQARGNGFVSREQQFFHIDSSDSKSDWRLYDGVQSDDTIAFRIDLVPGAYLVELLMAPGDHEIWRGAVTVNGENIVTELKPYRSNTESEAPPPYWIFMRKVMVRDNKMLLQIKADGQKTTVCGLSVFPDKTGPLKLKGGRIVSIEKPGAPNVELALRQINSGRITEAEKTIYALPEAEYGRIKAHLLLALAGRLEVYDPRPLIEWAAKLFIQEIPGNHEIEAALNLKLCRLYITADTYYKMAGWEWAKNYTGMGIFNRFDLVGMILAEMAEITEHPLYHLAMWNLGKTCFWGWMEQHVPRQITIADSCFSILNRFYPDHRLLNLYRGEPGYTQVPSSSTKEIPEWAESSSRALRELIDIIHYWVQYRQASNGEFGGKYDDDVEMLRWWPIARMAADDSLTLLGMQRLVNGIWHSGWIEKGFSKRVLDVEHAAEPVADTQPMMIGLDYGNPVYVERCMESMQGLYSLWTGVSQKGHRHFRSGWYSATEVDETAPKNCDIPMNTRTVKAARWLAWYNRHPVVMRFLKEWGDAWLEDCLRTENGKPYGVVPPAIRFDDDRIGGHSEEWYKPGLFWSYYDFHGGFDMMQQFLSLSLLLGDDRYLKPVELALEICEKYEGKDLQDATPGSEAWVAGIYLQSENFAQVVEQWRLMTGDTRFDQLLSRIGSDYLCFRISGDVDYLIRGSEKISQAIRVNPELITTEAYYTDRVNLKALRERADVGSKHLESMYTGKSLLKAFYPYSDLSWSGMGQNFSAVVLDSREDEILVWTHNSSDRKLQGFLSFWNLRPGLYKLSRSADLNQDQVPDEPINESEIFIEGPGTQCPVSLTSGSTELIKITALEIFPSDKHTSLCDLAVSVSDLEIKDNGPGKKIISVKVHNIGIKPAGNITVHVYDISGQKVKLIKEMRIDEIQAPLDLKPRVQELTFDLPSGAQKSSRIKVTVDPDNVISEITGVNNSIIFDL